MKKLVWDTSALLNIKEPNSEGYSPGASLYKDFNDGWIKGPYQNIFPAHSVFELQASISRRHREGGKMLRDFYVLNSNAVVFSIDAAFVSRAASLMERPGFDKLRGGDLIFACIAYFEDAYLVTLDKAFAKYVGDQIKVIDLNDSISSAEYRSFFE